jgi:hypothetical protein
MDELDIPDFLRRTEDATPTASVRRRREKKIPYPPNGGYTCKGKRKATRERHLAALRRRAEKMRMR